MSPLIHVSLLNCEIYAQFKQEVISKNTSSLPGIARPPMACLLYLIYCSAHLSKSWNEICFQPLCRDHKFFLSNIDQVQGSHIACAPTEMQDIWFA